MNSRVVDPEGRRAGRKLGEQLLLALGMPWEGRSPRVLTRAFEEFSFTAEGMGRLDQEAPHVGEINQEQLGQLLLPFAQEIYDGS